MDCRDLRVAQRVDFNPAIIVIHIPINVINIIVRIKRVALPRISGLIRAFGIGDTPTVKEHNGNIHAAHFCLDHALTHAVEVGLIKLCQIEFQFAVQCRAGACALIGLGCKIVCLCAFDTPLRLLPNIQTEKIVIVCLEKIEIGVIVERRRRIRPDAILQCQPGMRSRQIDCLTTAIGKITRIGRMDAQRSRYRTGNCR